MPSYFLKQPNGKYARFSTVVDNFTAMNMDRETALYRAKLEVGELEGEQKIARADKEELPGNGRPLSRWKKSIHTVEVIHGKKVAAEYEEEGTRDGV